MADYFDDWFRPTEVRPLPAVASKRTLTAAICDALEKCNAADDVAKVAIGKAEGHTCPAAPSWPPCSPSPPRPHWPAMMKSRSRRVDCLLIFEIERDSNRLAQSAQNLKRSFPL